MCVYFEHSFAAFLLLFIFMCSKSTRHAHKFIYLQRCVRSFCLEMYEFRFRDSQLRMIIMNNALIRCFRIFHLVATENSPFIAQYKKVVHSFIINYSMRHTLTYVLIWIPLYLLFEPQIRRSLKTLHEPDCAIIYIRRYIEIGLYRYSKCA